MPSIQQIWRKQGMVPLWYWCKKHWRLKKCKRKKTRKDLNYNYKNPPLFPSIPLDHVIITFVFPSLPLYKSTRVTITQNRDKLGGFVNGQVDLVHIMQNQTIILQLSNHKLVHIHPVRTTTDDNLTRVVYPLTPAHAIMICKVQGQTLKSTVVWFDVDHAPPKSPYVALSRVKELQQLCSWQKCRGNISNQSMFD